MKTIYTGVIFHIIVSCYMERERGNELIITEIVESSIDLIELEIAYKQSSDNDISR